MGLMGRARKAADFLSPPSLRQIHFNPRPWSSGGNDYYILNTFDNDDGHGGYSRRYSFDSLGIPYSETADGLLYNPLVVARYALKMLTISSVASDADAGEKAGRVLPCLVASGRRNGIWGVGDAPDAMSAEHPSCMIQGVVLSTILRLTDGRPHGETARVVEEASCYLVDPIEKGGTVSRMNGGVFLEEFPRTPPSHILNGCIYGLFALYDLADTCGPREKIFPLVKEIETTLAQSIDRFTTGLGWSRYALNVFGSAPLASVHYHRYHIALLQVVLARTQNNALARTVRRWDQALSSFLVRIATGFAKTTQSVWLRNIRQLPLAEG